MNFVGLDCYDGFVDSGLAKSPLIDGFVLGDLFCDRRMFAGGTPELLGIASDLSRQKKLVIYQTPLYLTESAVSDVLDVVRALSLMGNMAAVVVQDCGFANYISGMNGDFQVVWGRMGRARGDIYNKRFVEFVTSLGVTGFQVNNPQRAGFISDRDVTVYCMYGDMNYASLCRECYCEVLGLACGVDCERVCWHKHEVCRSDGAARYSVDGHVLDAKKSYCAEFEDYWANPRSSFSLIGTWRDAMTAQSVLADLAVAGKRKGDQ